MKTGALGRILKFVFHITPQHIVEPGKESVPYYQKFIASFSEDVKHIYLNENCPYNEVLLAGRLFQNRLHYIAPDFILLNHISRNHCADTDIETHTNHFRAKNIMRTVLLPLSRSGTIDASKHLHDEPDMTNDIKIMQQDEALQKLLSDIPKLSGTEQFDYEDQIIFLGTSGAGSTKYRGESGILIIRPLFGAFLIDAGEGTLATMKRVFGWRQTQQILKDLKAIFISHKHPDHMVLFTVFF